MMLKLLAAFVIVIAGLQVAMAAEWIKPIWHGSATSKKIALTFDDGPKPEQSGPILDTLDALDVKATFFIVGKECQLYPDFLNRMVRSGHELANHTYTHTRLDTLDADAIGVEIVSTNQLIEALTGKKMRYFRPPGGRFNRIVLEKAQEAGLETVLWDVNPGDYTQKKAPLDLNEDQPITNRSSKLIYEAVLRNIRGGSIVLFHNGGIQTVKAIWDVIVELQRQGYQMVTLSELLSDMPTVTRAR